MLSRLEKKKMILQLASALCKQPNFSIDIYIYQSGRMRNKILRCIHLLELDWSWQYFCLSVVVEHNLCFQTISYLIRPISNCNNDRKNWQILWICQKCLVRSFMFRNNVPVLNKYHAQMTPSNSQRSIVWWRDYNKNTTEDKELLHTKYIFIKWSSSKFVCWIFYGLNWHLQNCSKVEKRKQTIIYSHSYFGKCKFILTPISLPFLLCLPSERYNKHYFKNLELFKRLI